jgi:hypothetical protein
MSSGTSTGNVIDLGQTGRAAAGRLVALLRGTATKRIAATSNALFESVDDALFDMAERAASNVNQARFFDGMREIRKKRQAMDARFQEMVAKVFTDFEAGKLAPSADEVRSGSDGKRDHMALIEESELEETLAVTAMVDKAHARLVRPLFALSQRFASIAGGRKVDHANNPLGPRMLCTAFSQAVGDLEVDLQVKLILLKLFERHVLANLEPVYDEVNAMMVQAGVLPELRYHVARERTESAPRPRPAPAERAAESVQHFDTPEAIQREEAEIEGLVTELRGLLAARRAHHSPLPAGVSGNASTSGGTATRALGAQELLNALALMQNEIVGQLPVATPSLVPSPVRAGDVKNDLLRQIGRLGLAGNHGPHLGGNEDTIDLVGMLFEYAIQDRNLPAPIQALLGRLQIPYLKVALLDQNFVAHKNHPARRLLDELAQSCVGWSEDSDRDQRLFGKVNDVVNTLLKDFDDDLSIFERLNDDFTDFIDKNRRRSELAERRTAEAARGRERLESAQRTAARAILSQIGGRELPPMVRDLLTRRWSNYLVLTYLRHGEESVEWKNAVRFVEDFAWSVQPLGDNADRARLRERTPEMERLLKQGLAATGFHQSHVDELWNEVSALYGRQLDQNAPPAPAPAAAAPDEGDVEGLTIRFATSKVGEEIVFDQSNAIAEPETDFSAASQALETWIKIARALKTGTWFEFIKDDGSRERAKLLWISTIRALYLFVNRNGIKIAEKTANELAEELKSQRAVVLEQVALVDRALDAILQKLRTGPGDPAEPADAAATPAAPAADSAAAAPEAPPTRH